MFPRKKSIVTVEGFSKSYVDISELSLSTTPSAPDSGEGGSSEGGGGGSTSTARSLPIKGIGEIPMMYYNDDRNGYHGYLPNSFVIYPNCINYLYTIPDNPYDWADLPRGDFDPSELYPSNAPIPATFTFEMVKPDGSRLTGQETEAYEYFIVFTIEEDLPGSISLYFKGSFSTHVWPWNPSSIITDGATLFIHIVGDTIMIYQVSSDFQYGNIF